MDVDDLREKKLKRKFKYFKS